MFEDLLYRLKENVISVLFHFRFEPEDLMNVMPEKPTNMHEIHADASALEGKKKRTPMGAMPTDFDPEDPQTWEGHVSRNSLCPCGSDKKYKYCHGKFS